MKKIGRMFIEILYDIIFAVGYFIENNLRNLAALLSIALPFAMLLIGQNIALKRGSFAIGGEILIPPIVGVIIYFIRSLANKLGKGITVPTPKKRFTEVDNETGEVNILNDRVQELILYVADLEDWLQRKGLL